MNKPLILVVEDDPAVARLISTTLETRNYQYHRVLPKEPLVPPPIVQ